MHDVCLEIAPSPFHKKTPHTTTTKDPSAASSTSTQHSRRIQQQPRDYRRQGEAELIAVLPVDNNCAHNVVNSVHERMLNVFLLNSPTYFALHMQLTSGDLPWVTYLSLIVFF